MPPIKVGDEVVSHRNWMGNIGGEKKLHRMNIPGSHDSLAYAMSNNVVKLKNVVEKYSQCQEHNVGEQLNSGIRMIDVRLFLIRGLTISIVVTGKDRGNVFVIKNILENW